MSDFPLNIGWLYEYKDEIGWSLFSADNWPRNNLETDSRIGPDEALNGVIKGDLILLLDQTNSSWL